MAAPNYSRDKSCACCKHQRHRCSKDCILAPYFPADQPEKFSNVHRLFGVANVKKIIENMDPISRNKAMATIQLESDVRQQFPVSGCLGFIQYKETQIQRALEELKHLKLKQKILIHQMHTLNGVNSQPCSNWESVQSYPDMSLTNQSTALMNAHSFDHMPELPILPDHPVAIEESINELLQK